MSRKAKSTSRTWLAKPGSAAWWLRVFAAALFVFHINYARIHLLSEAHLDSFIDSISENAVAHHDGHDDDDDGDHHKPHSALAHLVQMVTKHPDSQLAIDFLPSRPFIFVSPPSREVVRIQNDPWLLPGESPPDPLQPRAPPLS